MSQISVTYTGDGTSVIFTIPFPYINQSDVQVLVNGSQVTAFTFVNATTIQFSVAPINGATIEIRRSTAADISNQFFANSSIRSQSLNENFQQTLFVSEEAREIAADAQAGGLVPGSIGTVVLADGAVTDAKVATGAAIAGTKISPNFGSQTVVTTGGFTGDLTGNVTGTASAIADNTVTSAKIVNGSIVDADISASASIADTKLDTIATVGKVSNSATTATDANTASAIVARSAEGNFNITSINGGPLAGFRNAIINGNFDVWQRGTSSGSFGYQTVDRWANSFVGSSNTVSRQAFALGQTDVPGEPVFFCRNTVSSVAGASNTSRLIQRIEGVRSFAGQQITISLWAKADAARPIALSLAQAFGTGGSPSTFVENHVGKPTLSTSWQRFTYTVSVPSISGKTIGSDGNDNLSFVIYFDAGSSFNTATDTLGQQSGTFDIAQVQVEAGPVATPFERRPIGTELSLCQRYYYRIDASSVGSRFSMSYNRSTVNSLSTVPFPVSMRTNPSNLEQSGTASDYSVIHGLSVSTVCSIVPSFVNSLVDSSVVEFTVSSGLTTGQAGQFRANSANAYLAWSAEL